jgi:hypothetical protein
MMITAMILAVSLVMLAQFGLFYWRALIAGVAACPVSHRVREASGLTHQPVAGEHFDLLASLDAICPDLEGNPQGMSLVRLYYRAVAAIAQVGRAALPALARWADGELLTCARYAAVTVDRRLERNRACIAEIFSH